MTSHRTYWFAGKVFLFCSTVLVFPMVCNSPTGHQVHILHIHHVVETRGLSAFDYAFAASGAILIIGGWMVIRSARSDGTQPYSPSSGGMIVGEKDPTLF